MKVTRTVTAAAALLLGAAMIHYAGSAEAFAATSRSTVTNYLKSITGSYTVSGQHNKEPATTPGQYTQQVHDITGQYPGLWGGDMMFRADDIANRRRVIDQAKTEWAHGSLVALTWHACSPTGGATCEFDVVSLDAWYKSYPSSADYQQIQSIAGSKPIAIAEMGKVPTAALFGSQPRWTYFMIWSEQLVGSNTNAEIQAAYFLPRVLNQGEMSFGTSSSGAG
jgi:hypothetical protein